MKYTTWFAGVLTAVLLPFAATGAEELKLHGLFTDNMILQRDLPVAVWGTAKPGEKVSVSFAGQTKNAVADETGKWTLKLEPLQASAEAQVMKVTCGGETLERGNIVVGDVWLCSGQSNMAGKVGEAQDANYPGIRLFKVRGVPRESPCFDLSGNWQQCSPETASKFSPVAYYFGRELHVRIGVPIGLLHAAEGSTPAESWTSRKTLETTPGLESIITAEFKEQKDAPAQMYNGRISPLIPFAIKGAIWYQGEANAARGRQYRTLLPALISDWRQNWGQGDFPFLIVQLPNYGPPVPSPSFTIGGWPELREAQYLTSKTVPNAGLAVTIDIGEADNLHPSNKKDVGLRLALAAKKVAYGEDVVASGPTFESMTEDNGRIRVKFSNVGSGLVAKGGELKAFAVSDGQRLVWAKAEIKAPMETGKPADTVVVWSDEMQKPVAVRYAFEKNPEGCNLYNKEGLPAAPFRTDQIGDSSSHTSIRRW